MSKKAVKLWVKSSLFVVAYFAIIIILQTVAMKNANASDWSQVDTQRQAAYLVLHAADWRQTRTIAKDDRFVEVNPILGPEPSTGEVDRYFLATALLHTAIAYNLSPEWRKGFQYVTIGVQATAVGHNYRLGVKFDW